MHVPKWSPFEEVGVVALASAMSSVSVPATSQSELDEQHECVHAYSYLEPIATLSLYM